MRKCLSVVLSLCLFVPLIAWGAVRGDKAMYVGGTLTAIPEGKQGRLDTTNETNLTFAWDKSTWETPFKSITRMEYGQKAGRRVGAAVLVSPLLLFSKKRKHYLTIHMKTEAGKSEAAVFELSKGTYQQVIASLEAKSGVKTEYETEDAKKEK